MSEKDKTPSLEIYERYDLEEQILSDVSLSRWFVEVCAGKQPSVEIDEVTLALMEGHGLVRKRDNDWVLAPDGRQFARKLGLVPGPSKFEVDPSLMEEVTPKSEVELSGTSGTKLFLQKTWETFTKTRDEHCRNVLMEHYLPLVKHIAHRLHAKSPDKVDLDDFISAGIFGLMDAIDAYDPTRGVRFEIYCSSRIRGSILDELRSMDWIPRFVRARAHTLYRATQTLEKNLGRKPTKKEIAEELNMNTEEFNRLRRDANAVSLVSLYTKYGDSDSEKDIREIDIIKDERSKDPFIAAQKQDLKKLLTKGLTRAERLIVVLYYYEDLSIKQIAESLDLSESRVSQMHSSIIARLKAQMGSRKKEFTI